MLLRTAVVNVLPVTTGTATLDAVTVTDCISYRMAVSERLNSGSGPAQPRTQEEKMQNRDEHDVPQVKTTHGQLQDEWRRYKDDNGATVHGCSAVCRDYHECSSSLQQDDGNLHEQVLKPSGRHYRHEVPRSISVRNMTSQPTRPGLEHREVMTAVATHVESVREVDDADSAADEAVKSKPGTWTDRAKSTVVEKCAAISRGKTTRKVSRVIAGGEVRVRKRSIWSGSVFGEKIEQPAKDTAQNTETHKRKASRALSDIIAESAQFIAGKVLRRDSGYAAKSPHGRDNQNSDQFTQSHAKNWPYQRPFPSQGECATGSISSLGSPHYSFVTAQEVAGTYTYEPSSRERADAVEELQPLIAYRSPSGCTRNMSEMTSRAMPLVQLAHTAVTPCMTIAQTGVENARVMLQLANRVHSQADEGRCAPWRVKQRFESIDRGVRNDVDYQRSVAREYLADIAAEAREMARDHKVAMEEWERKGRPVVSNWRETAIDSPAC